LHPDRKGDREADRDLGLALVPVMLRGLVQRKLPPAGTAEQALGLLEAAARNDPEDFQAWEARAEVLALLGRQAEALDTYQTILSRAPRREASLMGAAMAAQAQQKPELALSYWRRVVAENPWQPYYRASLAGLLADQKAWGEARTQCEAWVRLDPPSLEARVLWVRCLLRSGDRARARAEFARIERLRPPDLPVLRARFLVELRNR
jgi:tetratricopeptide (TPR) repeat protein